MKLNYCHMIEEYDWKREQMWVRSRAPAHHTFLRYFCIAHRHLANEKHYNNKKKKIYGNRNRSESRKQKQLKSFESVPLTFRFRSKSACVISTNLNDVPWIPIFAASIFQQHINKWFCGMHNIVKCAPRNAFNSQLLWRCMVNIHCITHRHFLSLLLFVDPCRFSFYSYFLRLLLQFFRIFMFTVPRPFNLND